MGRVITALLVSVAVMLCLESVSAQYNWKWFLIQHYANEDCSTETTLPNAEIFAAAICYNTSTAGKPTSRRFTPAETNRIDLYRSADCSGNASASIDIVPGACMKELNAKLFYIPDDQHPYGSNSGPFDGSGKYGPVSMVFSELGCPAGDGFRFHFQLEAQAKCQRGTSQSTSVMSTAHEDVTTIVQYQGRNCSSDQAAQQNVTRVHGICVNDYTTQTSAIHANVTTAFDLFNGKYTGEWLPPFRRFDVAPPPDKDWVLETENNDVFGGARLRAWYHVRQYGASLTCASGGYEATDWILEAFECYQLAPGVYIRFGFAGVTTYSQADCEGGVVKSIQAIIMPTCIPIAVEKSGEGEISAATNMSLEVVQTGITEDSRFEGKEGYEFVRVVADSCVLNSAPKFQLIKKRHCLKGPPRSNSNVRFEHYSHSSQRYLFDVYAAENLRCEPPYEDGYLLEYAKCYEYEDQGMVTLVSYKKARSQLESLFTNTTYRGESITFPFVNSAASASGGGLLSIVLVCCITLLVSL